MPRLRHIFERPGVEEVRARADGTTEVRVTGLACTSLCVRRTEAALRSLPGVTDVTFSSDPDVFRVKTSGPPPDAPAMARAVRSMVVAFWARRLLAALGEWFRPGRP